MLKKIFYISLLLMTIIIGTIYFCNLSIVNTAKGKLYADAQSIPYNRVGLLLGTSKYMTGGYRNPYYDYRIDAAVQLLKEEKIKYIIVSGDNGTKYYNEPGTMRKDLMKAGIDSTVIYLDYAGFRTFDSIIRLKEIFGQDSVTVISQQFHNERAIYTATKAGIKAIGYNARDVSVENGFRTQVREKFARVKAILDIWIGMEPRYLGKKISIPE